MDNNIIYANSASLSYSLCEMRLVFSQDSPYGEGEQKSSAPVADIRMSPQLAKLLRDILVKGISNYESQVGEVPMGKAPAEEQ